MQLRNALLSGYDLGYAYDSSTTKCYAITGKDRNPRPGPYHAGADVRDRHVLYQAVHADAVPDVRQRHNTAKSKCGELLGTDFYNDYIYDYCAYCDNPSKCRTRAPLVVVCHEGEAAAAAAAEGDRVAAAAAEGDRVAAAAA